MAKTITAAAERIFPADSETPGATDATSWNGSMPDFSLRWTPEGPVVVLTYPLTADDIRFIPESSNGLSGWQRLRLGSTTNAVVRGTGCSVLVANADPG